MYQHAPEFRLEQRTNAQAIKLENSSGIMVQMRRCINQSFNDRQ